MLPMSDPLRNRLLAALPPEEWQGWKPRLEYVKLTLGQVLSESGGVQSHVYFPTTSIVSTGPAPAMPSATTVIPHHCACCAVRSSPVCSTAGSK